MVIQLLFALALTVATVIIHGLGTLAVIAHLSRVRQRTKENPGDFVSVIQILRVVGVLLLLHWIEAGIWAVFYVATGALPDIETATYFSLASYTTLGYGDVVLPAPWRLLGPLEAAVGILMFGWSTGVMVAAITKVYGRNLRLLSE